MALVNQSTDLVVLSALVISKSVFIVANIISLLGISSVHFSS